MANRWRSGNYTPMNPEKYKGTYPIVYRSSWEKRLLLYFDQTSSILAYGSESVVIPYYSPTDKKMHRYFVDFNFECLTVDGKRQTFWCEVKPYAETIKPNRPSSKSVGAQRKYVISALTWVQNQAKWSAAHQEAERRGVKFFVLTERDAKFLTAN